MKSHTEITTTNNIV